MKTQIATHHEATIKEVKTHFIRLGDPLKTRKLIFLHGWGGSTNSFFKIATDLVEQDIDREIILLDFPGFGFSHMPPQEGWDTYDYADHFHEFITETLRLDPANIDIYNHSFGGRITTRLVNRYEEYKGKIIYTGAAGIKHPPTTRQKITKKGSKAIKPIQKYIPSRIQNLVLTKILGARDWGNVAPILKPTLTKVIAEKDFRTDLCSIKNKCLLLWGNEDNITPIQSAYIYSESIPNSKLIIFENGRHGIHHTHQEEIKKEILKFLS